MMDLLKLFEPEFGRSHSHRHQRLVLETSQTSQHTTLGNRGDWKLEMNPKWEKCQLVAVTSSVSALQVLYGQPSDSEDTQNHVRDATISLTRRLVIGLMTVKSRLISGPRTTGINGIRHLLTGYVDTGPPSRGEALHGSKAI